MKEKLLLLNFLIFVFSCSMNNPYNPTTFDFEPPVITIYGVADGDVVESVTPCLEKESGVSYDVKLNGIAYSWTKIETTGSKILRVVATKKSNNMSSVKILKFVVAHDEYLVITSPTSEDEYDAGDNISIKWETSESDKVTISLYKDSEFISDIGKVKGSTGEFNWDIPTDIVTGDDYKIVITNIKNNKITDTSSNFAIKNTPAPDDATLELISAHTGKTYDAGGVIDIKWSTNLSDNVIIGLYKNNSRLEIIATVIGSEGHYTWTVPVNSDKIVTGSDYQIKITNENISALTDKTGIFTIKNSQIPPPYLLLITPEEDTVYEIGTSLDITWDTSETGNIVIELYKNGNFLLEIGSANGEDGCFTYNIPDNIVEASDYQIKVKNVNDETASDIGDFFTINNPPPSNVTNLKVSSVAVEKVTLTWTPPSDSGFDGVFISSDPADYMTTPVKVAKGTNTYTVDKLTYPTKYTFTVKSVDTAGSVASGVSVSGTPSKPDCGTLLTPEYGFQVEPVDDFVTKSSSCLGHSISLSGVTGGAMQIQGRKVTLSSFYISIVETVYLSYNEVQVQGKSRGYSMADGRNGSGTGGAGREPVTNISWKDTIVFCNVLSKLCELTPLYYTDSTYTTEIKDTNFDVNKIAVKPGAEGFRLPTEAEWEYAARGGQKTKHYTYPGSNNPDEVGWNYSNSGGTTHSVYLSGGSYETKLPNELGLYDMAGNVWEFVWDWYGFIGEFELPEINPAGPASGDKKINRGASWDASNGNKGEFTSRGTMGDLRSVTQTMTTFGFRVVKTR